MSKPIKTDTRTLIDALKILADDLISQDGIANSAILEAAYRLEEYLEKEEKEKIKADISNN